MIINFRWFFSSSSSDGNLSQSRSHHTQVHYLFNTVLSNLTESPFDTNLLNTWKTLYEVSYRTNQSRPVTLSKRVFPFFDLQLKPAPNYLIILILSTSILLLINICLCLLISKCRYARRKHQYNCLNNHKQLNSIHHPSDQVVVHHGGSSPSSTNSNGTITIDSTQHLIINTNSHEQDLHGSPLSSLLCTTTTTNGSSSPIDILHPINITKKNGILKCSTMKKNNTLIPSSLPEAVV